MPIKTLASATFIAAALLLAFPGAGEARIQCDKEFQISSSGPIATPACADRYLADIARRYGMRVTYRDVRNPSVKQQVCEFVGNDIRLRTICSGWRNDGLGGSRIR